MHRTNDRELDREVTVLGRALLGCPPGEYVRTKYLDYHSQRGIAVDSFDRMLLRFALHGPFFTAAADAYATRFRRGSALRKKLVLLLALGECAPPTCERLDALDSHSGAMIAFRLGLRALWFLAALVTGTLMIGPAHAVLALRGRA